MKPTRMCLLCYVVRLVFTRLDGERAPTKPSFQTVLCCILASSILIFCIPPHTLFSCLSAPNHTLVIFYHQFSIRNYRGNIPKMRCRNISSLCIECSSALTHLKNYSFYCSYFCKLAFFFVLNFVYSINKFNFFFFNKY